MRYQLLGKSGMRVSEVCMGTMMMGVESNASAGAQESRKILETFADRGGNYFDTSNEVYQGGLSEQILGDFIQTDRERFVVTTKYTNTIPSMMNPALQDHPNKGGNHKKSMVQSVEGSLKRLNTDYIDLLWIHFWDYSTDIETVMRNVNDLVQQGKVLHFGLCNTPAWVVARGQTVADLRGWEPISALQYQYNLLSRDLDHEVFPCAQALGISMNAYSALAGGFLTGKYTRGDNGEPKRFDDAYWASIQGFGEREHEIAKAVDAIADELGVTSSAVALAWVQGRGVLPIIGARKVSQVEDSLAHIGLRLSEEHMNQLNTLSAPERTWTYKLLHDDDSIIRQLASSGMLADIDNPHFPR